LADIEDDIIDTNTDDTQSERGHTTKQHMKSQHTGKLYIEQTRKSSIKLVTSSIAYKYILTLAWDNFYLLKLTNLRAGFVISMYRFLHVLTR